MNVIRGRIWKFDHNIDTDVIIPACHLVLPLQEMAQYTMAPVCPEFAAEVRTGDLIVAGRNFGCGSSREQAPAVLKALGIRAVVAKSFARIFFRNAVNLGMVVITCQEIYEQVQQDETLEIYPESGRIEVPPKKSAFSGSKLPDFLLEIVAAGGLIPHLAAKAEAPEKH